ncbi:hypothetical protein IWW48_004762 [Coemansia sp. RSA 1200]|nr:hypothetical protein IWW48_004762 [Coemansia sp. RSA 1200]
MSKITTRLRNGAKGGRTAVADTATTTNSKQKATTRGPKEATKNASAPQRKTTAVHHAPPPQQQKTAITRSSRAKATTATAADGSGNGSTQTKRRKHAAGVTPSAKRGGATQLPSPPADPIRPRTSAKTDATISNGANSSAPNNSGGNNVSAAAAAAAGTGVKLDGKKRRSKALPPPSLKRTRSKTNVTTAAKEPVPLLSKKGPRHIAIPRPSETTKLARELSETSISSEETTPTTTPAAAAAAVNFIMSSPKREPRKALTKIRGVPDRGLAASANGQQQPCRRRRAESSDDDEEEEGQLSGMVRSPPPPPLKRMRIAGPASGIQRLPPAVPLSELPRLSEPAKQSADESNGAKSRAKGLAAGHQGGAQSSPLKAILSPVFDLLRRVSGIAQDPLGLQRHDSRSFIEEEEEEEEDGSRGLGRTTSKENVYPGSPPSETSEVDPAGAPVDSPEANSLTAPPMNPTTLGTAVSAGLSASHSSELHQEEAASSSYSNGSRSGSGSGISRSSSGMQLYLADAGEYQLSDSCSASPLTGTYPETPSKENIPVYGEHDVLVGLDSAETGGIAVLGPAELPAGAELGSGDSDLSLSLSHISSVSDTEFDTEAYFAYDEDDEFNPYLFMAELPPIPREHTLRPYALPRKTRSSPPITLVLDLDETLVHCALNKVENADLVFPVEYNGINYSVYCRLRPGYREFLERASELFEVVVFTASQQVYADRLLNLIDPDRRFIRHRLFRDSCVYIKTNYIKDLGILGRDVRKMVLVDNCPQAFAYHQSNGIPIESWYEDKNDRELAHLMDFLMTLVGEDDVRPKVEAFFRTNEKVLEAKKRFQMRGRRVPTFIPL